jgi:hypothetical protein
MDINKWIKRNPVTALFLGGIGLSVALSSGNLMQNAQSVNMVRQIAQQNAAIQMQLQATAQSTQQRAKIAVARYQDGCVMVVATNNPDAFTTLTEGQAVIDSVRQTPLPVGTVVCDANGNTAVIAPAADGTPVASQLAFTGDRAVIQAAMARVDANYQAPQQ